MRNLSLKEFSEIRLRYMNPDPQSSIVDFGGYYKLHYLEDWYHSSDSPYVDSKFLGALIEAEEHKERIRLLQEALDA